MFIGAIAGLAAAVATNPLDVVKTNIMTQQDYKPRAFLCMAWELQTKYGASIFLKGIVFRSIYITTMSIFFFYAYEQGNQVLYKRFFI